MYKIIVFIIVLSSINLFADSDFDGYIKPKHTEYSKKYKVKDFYGKWIVVKVRFVYPCLNGSEINDKVLKLGKEVTIGANFYKNTLHSNISTNESSYLNNTNAYLGKMNIFYVTLSRNINGYFYGKPYPFVLEGLRDIYDIVQIYNYNKDNQYYTWGDYNLLFIKNKNTLIYWEYTSYDDSAIDNPLTLYMLVREEEAKKLDKYEVYVPKTQIEDEPESYDYDKQEYYKAGGCPASYDEYAKKLEAEGKYKVIRDSKMARNFIDID